MRLTPRVCVTVAAIIVGVLTSPAAAGDPGGSRTPLPVSYMFSDAVAFENDHPGSPPPGANDWSCAPSPQHPNPVVLVHGGPETVRLDWGAMAPLLANNGYCVFAPTYGTLPDMPGPLGELGGLTPIEQSAQQLREFVDRVRTTTGAQEVDLVAHSQGSLVSAYYTKVLGGADKVARLVSIGPGWNGTTSPAFASLFTAFVGRLGLTPPPRSVVEPVCASCGQIQAGSDFLRKLNEGSAAVPGVNYTNIITRHDDYIVPYSSGFLQAPKVTNHLIQEYCPNDLTDHLLLPYDRVVAQLVLNTLDPTTTQRPTCTTTPPNS
ncbi:esterase/lipase family protein [Nocardia sp. NPDC049149]|uniref:esterase/lipase family protein n=1 Tax=Nocardia sp. NPDC049149 TaxID=3364315 RepID=UPI003713FB87